jgi:hypothetical protein
MDGEAGGTDDVDRRDVFDQPGERHAGAPRFLVIV